MVFFPVRFTTILNDCEILNHTNHNNNLFQFNSDLPYDIPMMTTKPILQCFNNYLL